MAPVRAKLSRRIPIGFRVAAGVGGLVLLFLTITALAITTVVRLTGSEQRFDDHYLPYATSISDAALGAKGMANDERGFLLTGDATFVTEMHVRESEVRAAFTAASAAAATEEQRRAVVTASEDFERWAAGVAAEVATFRAGNRTAARDWSLGPGRDIRKQYEGALDVASADSDQAIASNSAAFSSRASRSVTILIASLLVALAASIAIGVWLVRTVLAPVHSLVAMLGRFDELRVLRS